MNENQNPFLSEYHTPHQTVPFHLIRTEHFEPAILQGMEEHDREIADIIANPDEPTSRIPSKLSNSRASDLTE